MNTVPSPYSIILLFEVDVHVSVDLDTLCLEPPLGLSLTHLFFDAHLLVSLNKNRKKNNN